MSQVMLEETGSQWDHWIDHASRGEEIIITRGAVPVAQLIPVHTEKEPNPKRPGHGAGKDDIIYMADDFDAPLEGFNDYM